MGIIIYDDPEGPTDRAAMERAMQKLQPILDDLRAKGKILATFPPPRSATNLPQKDHKEAKVDP